MAELTSRRDHWTDVLPESWRHNMNTNPLLNALGRAMNRPTPDLGALAMREYGTPEQQAAADQDWLLQKMRGPKLNPLAAEMLDKGGMLANFLGPGVKLPPMAPKPTGIRAYHGSPYDFDRFDTSKAGEHFFSESETFAKHYKPAGGRMYEVNIQSRPDQLIDLDKPFSDQADAVRNGILNTGFPRPAENESMRSVFARLVQSGADRRTGLNGLTYMDDGARSYSIWNDNLIEILRKYGLLPPVAAGTAAALNQQEPPL